MQIERVEMTNKVDTERDRGERGRWGERNVFSTYNCKKKLQKYGNEEYIEIILLIDKHGMQFSMK